MSNLILYAILVLANLFTFNLSARVNVNENKPAKPPLKQDYWSADKQYYFNGQDEDYYLKLKNKIEESDTDDNYSLILPKQKWVANTIEFLPGYEVVKYFHANNSRPEYWHRFTYQPTYIHRGVSLDHNGYLYYTFWQKKTENRGNSFFAAISKDLGADLSFDNSEKDARPGVVIYHGTLEHPTLGTGKWEAIFFDEVSGSYVFAYGSLFSIVFDEEDPSAFFQSAESTLKWEPKYNSCLKQYPY